MNNTARIALVISGAFAALFAALLLSLGGLSLYGEAEKDGQGYLATDSERLETGTRALKTGNLDADLDGIESVLDETDFGDIRLEVESRAEEPVFVGIARTDDVTDYLHGVRHTEVSAIDYGPFDEFHADYDDRYGSERPAPPAKSDIWVASEQGSGRQTLEWDVKDGDWSVVVMNADGSRGVDADVSAGARIPFLGALGASLLGAGGFTLLVGVALMVVGIRGRKGPGSATAGTAPAPGFVSA